METASALTEKGNPTMREKLIEFLDEASFKLKELCGGYNDGTGNTVRADHLIANGVTVTDNNVGCKCDYCHEDADGYRKMIGAFSITNPFHGRTWQIETAHCKPRQIYFCPMCGRKLAEPPKGE